VLATGASGGNTKRSAKKTVGLPAGLDGVAPYQNTARKANCIVRAPPAVVMTPNVAWSLRLVPGEPQFRVLVTPEASRRTSKLNRSRTRTRLISEAARPLDAGLRNSPNAGGSGEIVYCDGSETNAVVSKYGLSACRVAGSTRSPRRRSTGPLFAALRRRIGRPLLSLIESGLPAWYPYRPLSDHPPASLPLPKGRS